MPHNALQRTLESEIPVLVASVLTSIREFDVRALGSRACDAMLAGGCAPKEVVRQILVGFLQSSIETKRGKLIEQLAVNAAVASGLRLMPKQGRADCVFDQKSGFLVVEIKSSSNTLNGAGRRGTYLNLVDTAGKLQPPDKPRHLFIMSLKGNAPESIEWVNLKGQRVAAGSEGAYEVLTCCGQQAWYALTGDREFYKAFNMEILAANAGLALKAEAAIEQRVTELVAELESYGAVNHHQVELLDLALQDSLNLPGGSNPGRAVTLFTAAGDRWRPNDPVRLAYEGPVLELFGRSLDWRYVRADNVPGKVVVRSAASEELRSVWASDVVRSA